MKKIRLELKKSWCNFHAGDEVNFDESKGRPLIANGTGVEIPAYKQNKLIPNKIQEQKQNIKKIRLLLKKNWGGFHTGDKVMFDERKGRPIIERGEAIEIPSTNRKGELLPNKIDKKAGNSKIMVKLLKNWGNYFAGDVVTFGSEKKAQEIIDNKIGILAGKKKEPALIQTK